MAVKKDIPQVRNPPSGDGHHVTYRYMTATELAERDARQDAYDAMLARQDAYERSREATAKKTSPIRAGCTFAKSCKLPDAIIDYSNPSGRVPTDSLKAYGDLILLGAREADASGGMPLKKIGATAIPAGLGGFALAGSAIASLPTAAIGAAAAPLAVLVGLFMPSNLADSALYTDDQLQSLKQARTRVRLRVEQQTDGSLKGYGFYTGTNRGWEMVDVVGFDEYDNQFVADLGDGIKLIWTPAVDGSDILGIPALEAAPQAPHIWVYPPTKAADTMLVNPVYPPDYKDFILVFPAGSGVRPVYVVISRPISGDHGYHTPPNSLPAFPDAVQVRNKGQRKRWESKKRIYEWDYQHGAVEVYNWEGDHLGEFDATTGEQTGKARSKRRTTTK